MNKEIEEIINDLQRVADRKCYPEDILCGSIAQEWADYITNLQKEDNELKKQNNDLRKIYRNTYKKLFDNGNDELAGYFQAQINECPTFYVEPIIDYYKEYNKQKEVLDKIKEYCKSKIEEQKNMTDFSKYYLENYDKAINTQHLSHSGVMLETIKSTTIKRYEDILELLEEIE